MRRSLLVLGFGMEWKSTFRDPRYERIDRDVKIPTL